jgi:hypothetical protein
MPPPYGTFPSAIRNAQRLSRGEIRFGITYDLLYSPFFVERNKTRFRGALERFLSSLGLDLNPARIENTFAILARFGSKPNEDRKRSYPFGELALCALTA